MLDIEVLARARYVLKEHQDSNDLKIKKQANITLCEIDKFLMMFRK